MNSPAIVAWMKEQEAKRNPGLDHDKPEEPWPVSPVAPISERARQAFKNIGDTGLMELRFRELFSSEDIVLDLDAVESVEIRADLHYGDAYMEVVVLMKDGTKSEAEVYNSVEVR
jgi:hypothetical protein